MADTPAGAPVGDTPAAPAVVATPVATPTPAANPAPVADPKATPADPKATPAPTGADPKPTAQPAPVGDDIDDTKGKDTDWAAIRTKIANGDEKLEKRLARYSSVESLAQALIAAQAKISDGSLKSALPKNATPEQIATWREENGIPADPTGYDLTMPDGLIIGEEDKPVVDEFIKHAHGLNLTPEQAKANVAWYLGVQEQQAEALANADLEAREAGENAIRELWGAEAKLNKQLIVNFIDTAPDGVGDLIKTARLGDGTPLASNPAVLRWLADSARAINPVATVVPGAGSNAAQAIETELAGIVKLMGDKKSDYWVGPQSAKMQERYRQLVDVQSRMG